MLLKTTARFWPGTPRTTNVSFVYPDDTSAATRSVTSHSYHAPPLDTATWSRGPPMGVTPELYVTVSSRPPVVVAREDHDVRRAVREVVRIEAERRAADVAQTADVELQ